MHKFSKEDAPQEFLELFFPIHYTIGMTVEDTLRSSILTRQQTIILWLIQSEGENGMTMHRKEIVKSMSYWFELTSSAISKALRSLARSPLALVSITEDPNSGREKIVTLTPKGQKFLLQMMENGRGLIRRMTDAMTEDEVNMCLHSFKLISQLFQTEVEEKRELAGSTIVKSSVKKRI